MLRWLAHGNWMSVEFARSVGESVFVSQILRGLRSKAGEHLEDIARHYASEKGLPFRETKDQKVVYTELARIAGENLANLLPSKPDDAANRRVRQLEAELAKEKAKNLLSSKATDKSTDAPKEDKKPAPKSKGKARENKRDEEDDLPVEHPLSPLHEYEGKPLAKSSPTSGKPKDVNSWIDGLGLGQKKKDQLVKLTTKVQAKFKDYDSEGKQDELELLAHEWGLPMRLIVNTAAVQLIRIISAAYIQTH